MNKTVWTFGLIAGAILGGMMLLTLPFADQIEHSEVIGYSSMVAAFLLIYFGVRSYRDAVGGGTVGFGRALAVGVLITCVGSACYVATWEALYYGKPGFAEKFEKTYVESVRAKAASPAEADKIVAETKKMFDMYKNPAINVALTFLEPLPVGIIIALVTAGVLRRRKQATA